MYYHSSPVDITGKFLIPCNSSVLNDEKAVFVSNRRFISLMFGAKWTDEDIEFRVDDGVWKATEMYPNAFRKIFFNKFCYIYHVEKIGFQTDKRLGLKGFEFINKNKVKIVKKKFIPDIWNELQKTAINFIFF